MAKVDQREQTEIEISSKKQGMTLKSVPISLKKIKKVITDLSEQLKEDETNITLEQKFELEVTGMYLGFLKDTVAKILEES